MKDERTLADRLEAGSARVGEGLCHFHDVEGAEESFAGIASLLHEAAQALRSQPSVEDAIELTSASEVLDLMTGGDSVISILKRAGVSESTQINVAYALIAQRKDAARQINSLYEGKGTP